ncbi:MAG: hypothetical protein ACJAWM_000566 [Sulfitobacter sp.]|jgi:hypothetical protein
MGCGALFLPRYARWMKLPGLDRDDLPAIGLGVTQIMDYGTLM